MVFDVFSKRNKALPDVFVNEPLTLQFRQQVLHLWKRTLRCFEFTNRSGRTENNVLAVVEKIVSEEHGLASLGQHPEAYENVPKALLSFNNTDILLDIIELSFALQYTMDKGQGRPSKEQIDDAVNGLNYRFREHGLAYEFDKSANRLIPVTNIVTHQLAVRPTLTLLASAAYDTANTEFLEAFEDFKKGDYPDCLTKCCAAFESVMKVICYRRGWSIPPKATARNLVEKVTKETNLDKAVFEPCLLIIADMRHNLGSAHGGGTATRQPTDYIARYALNATASAILLLHEAEQATT